VNILVTGGTGLLGSTLVPFFRDLGHDVFSLGHASSGDGQVDLADRARVADLLDAVSPQAILSLAALSDVDLCERERHLAWEVNCLGVENLAAWLRPRPEVTLVHLSTDQLYSLPGLSHEAEVRISNVYGLSKYAGELAALSVGGTVLRTNFFGPSRRPGRVSQSDWFLSAFRQGQEITLFQDIAFNPLSMATLSRMLEMVVQEPRAGVFNLTSREGFSKAKFALALAKRFELSTEKTRLGASSEFPAFEGRPKDTRGDPGRFEAAWGLIMPTLEAEIASLEK
jgi:dTDP-4-dehydrorhamnose reductase